MASLPWRRQTPRDFLTSDLALVIGRMATACGTLPTVVLFGQAALTERTGWHVGFDYAVLTRFWKHEAEARTANNPNARAALNRSRVRGKRGTGDNLPDL
ncbi:hypothetical protein [Deinococcus peraridilitoris]|uniref:Uncharacterized protein n=1 Tax=Deinococcus peraridilitoris (strain DSM 19664 / LMG 22246 / CIP 109416 / KR-200) TaxID=937777 RepID=K9ZZF5_DEIPD|nr:hypothetical protein [Deinococcus peraridilitoris]AFZ66981.1 hypothetical protein Deipe_1440 [Deinococcus peraridilitoris DSM 19664]